MVQFNIEILSMFVTLLAFTESSSSNTGGNTGDTKNFMQRFRESLSSPIHRNPVQQSQTINTTPKDIQSVPVYTSKQTAHQEPGKDLEPTTAGPESLTLDSTTQQTDINRINKRFLFLNLKLTLNVAMDGGSMRKYEVVLPAPQILGVMEAFIQAASVLSETYPNAQNPFNLSLRYNGQSGCIQVVRAFGVKADNSHEWVINVQNYQKKSVYRGVCLPDRRRIKVGPFYEVSLTYTHINDTGN